MAPREWDRLDEKCVVCGGPVGPGWFVESVDAWGERVWGGYMCSLACVRKTGTAQKKALSS